MQATSLRSLRRGTTLVIAAIGFSGACTSDDPSAPAPNPAVNDASLQVIPGVPSVSAVDVVVDGEVKLRNAAYGVPSTIIAVPHGAHSIRVVAAGSTPGSGGATVSVSANDTLRVVAIGSAASISTVALGDTGATPVPGKGKLRVSHLATNAPPIDVWRSQPDYREFIRVMFPFAYRASSPFLESTPGNWIVRVTRENGSQILAESAPIRVDALWVRTVVILDAPGGGVRITALGDP
jgi:hypothetical protein